MSQTDPSSESAVRLSVTLTRREAAIIAAYQNMYGLNRSAALRAIINTFAQQVAKR